MSNRRKKRRRRGHYCWCCRKVLANERFSGRGHSRHLCKRCAKLGAEELAYRQALRDLERLVTPEGIIPRKRRKQVEKFLGHENERVRRHARELQSLDAHTRALLQQNEAVGRHEEPLNDGEW